MIDVQVPSFLLQDSVREKQMMIARFWMKVRWNSLEEFCIEIFLAWLLNGNFWSLVTWSKCIISVGRRRVRVDGFLGLRRIQRERESWKFSRYSNDGQKEEESRHVPDWNESKWWLNGRHASTMHLSLSSDHSSFAKVQSTSMAIVTVTTMLFPTKSSWERKKEEAEKRNRDCDLEQEELVHGSGCWLNFLPLRTSNPSPDSSLFVIHF